MVVAITFGLLVLWRLKLGLLMLVALLGGLGLIPAVSFG
jgi:hypothetical protein